MFESIGLASEVIKRAALCAALAATVAQAQEAPLAGATAGEVQANMPNASPPSQILGRLLDVPNIRAGRRCGAVLQDQPRAQRSGRCRARHDLVCGFN